MKVGQETCRVH